MTPLIYSHLAVAALYFSIAFIWSSFKKYSFPSYLNRTASVWSLKQSVSSELRATLHLYESIDLRFIKIHLKFLLILLPQTTHSSIRDWLCRFLIHLLQKVCPHCNVIGSCNISEQFWHLNIFSRFSSSYFDFCNLCWHNVFIKSSNKFLYISVLVW